MKHTPDPSIETPRNIRKGRNKETGSPSYQATLGMLSIYFCHRSLLWQSDGIPAIPASTWGSSAIIIHFICNIPCSILHNLLQNLCKLYNEISSILKYILTYHSRVCFQSLFGAWLHWIIECFVILSIAELEV